jgi:hypothetical protein
MPALDYAYAAHTDSCIFLLDAQGYCREILPALREDRTEPTRPRSAERCVGAQYVASLDSDAEGGLSDMPHVGAPMLFARIETGGRIALIRTSPLLKFETRAAALARSSMPPSSAIAFPLVTPPDPGSLPRFDSVDRIQIDADVPTTRHVSHLARAAAPPPPSIALESATSHYRPRMASAPPPSSNPRPRTTLPPPPPPRVLGTRRSAPRAW